MDFPEWYRKYTRATQHMKERIAILRNPDVSQLLESDSNYDCQVLGNLTVSPGVTAKAATYNRSFGLTTGIHTTSFSGDGGNTYTGTIYCSYPDQVCVYQLISTANLPEVLISLENQLVNSTTQNQTCGKGYVRPTSITQADLLLG